MKADDGGRQILDLTAVGKKIELPGLEFEAYAELYPAAPVGQRVVPIGWY